MNKAIQAWADKLLDTGNRNNLVNYRDRKEFSVEVIAQEPHEIFDALVHGKGFEVFDPKGWFKEHSPGTEEFPKSLNRDKFSEAFWPNVGKGEVLLYNLFNTDSVHIVKKLDHKISASIEETGVNIGYIFYGLVEWKDGNSACYAPLLLLPVNFIHDKPNDPYVLQATDDDIVVNPTFNYKIKAEFGIELPDFDDKMSLPAYLQSVGEVVKKLGWSVSDGCKLSLFSFLKINMYKDLLENESLIVENPNIKCLLGEDCGNDPSSPVMGEADLGEDFNELVDIHNVVDADSSQLEAIKLAKAGKSFVLQGPPGTGKSQTIANIIAESLFDNKKVLFVSEKQAALNVVFEKLKHVGLSDFCLELHSHKANKKDFVSELARTLRMSCGLQKVDDNIQKVTHQAKLDSYDRSLHCVRPVIGKSFYELFNNYLSYKSSSDVPYIIKNISEKDEIYRGKVTDAIGRYVEYAKKLGAEHTKCPWYGFTSHDVTIQGKNEVKETFSTLEGCIRELLPVTSRLNEACGIKFSRVSELHDGIDFLKKFLHLKGLIDESFECDFYELDGAGLSKRLKLYDGVFSRLISKEYHQIKKSVKLCARSGFKVDYCNICKYLGLLADFQSLSANVKSSDEFESFASFLEGFVRQTEPLYQKVESLFDGSIFDCRESSFDDVIAKLTKCLDDFEHLETWKSLQKVLAEMGELNAVDYLECCLTKDIPLEEMKDGYSKLFYALWVDYLKNEDDILGDFDRIAHGSVVCQFSEADEKDLVENRKKIKNHLLKLKPSSDWDIQGSGISVINHEAQKQKKIKPVRRLMSEVGATIQAIKPCFLMSPLSVSTFIPAGSVKFDTVIFDEASQVFPQDAIGAIYRGKQVIVVGDSKQMPPTNFFNADLDVSDEDDYDDLTDYESILDLCSTSFRQLSLLWHYRSRFEQLIAFSNQSFYGGKLITFPSAMIDRKGIGVDYYHVDGCFEHKSRYNVVEANRVVDLILEHVKDYPERSLGVVAFNVAQQDLIEQFLEKRTNGKREYDCLFDKSVQEPFFIKNLESVQGDERDTIIFSTAYGKDTVGKVMHNFGPLNKQGGERRLNVAVSRARINVQVVSSMHGTDIDLTKTSARGAKLLKLYLDFAEKGPIALSSEPQIPSMDEFDSHFEMEVCEYLRSEGFTVDTQVGCSGFRIDLGIRKPDSSEYFLAVECDGASYHSSKNARDRDRLRQSILERMGWNFYRVWSTDWFRHESSEKQSLLNAVRKAEEMGPRKIPDSNATKKVVSTDIPEVEWPEKSETQVKNIPFGEFIYENEAAFVAHEEKAFFDDLKTLLTKEIAVSKKALMRRIAERRYGQKRITARIESYFNMEISHSPYYGIVERDGFLFLKDQYEVPFRIPGDKRPIDDISLEELSHGMLTLIKAAVSIDKMSLFKEVNTLQGYDRLGPNILDRLESALGRIADQFNFDGEQIFVKLV